jgi:hypothetical protein
MELEGFIYHVHKNPPLDPTLSQMNQVPTLISHSFAEVKFFWSSQNVMICIQFLTCLCQYSCLYYVLFWHYY